MNLVCNVVAKESPNLYKNKKSKTDGLRDAFTLEELSQRVSKTPYRKVDHDRPVQCLVLSLKERHKYAR